MPAEEMEGPAIMDAFELAKHRILTGPDSPGKRFLEGKCKGVNGSMREVVAKNTNIPPVKRRFKTLAEEFRAMETMPLPERDDDAQNPSQMSE